MDLSVAPLPFALALAGGLAACSHTQSTPTPVAGTGSVTTSTSTTTTSVKPWTNTATTSSMPIAAQGTAPMDGAMLLCTHALNLAPCGLVTTGMTDVTNCFTACQVQIQIVEDFMIERAARACAALPPPEDRPRTCTLQFPATANVDREEDGKKCDARCEAMAEEATRPTSQ